MEAIDHAYSFPSAYSKAHCGVRMHTLPDRRKLMSPSAHRYRVGIDSASGMRWLDYLRMGTPSFISAVLGAYARLFYLVDVQGVSQFKNCVS
jgi:hypothetical protein